MFIGALTFTCCRITKFATLTDNTLVASPKSEKDAVLLICSEKLLFSSHTKPLLVTVQGILTKNVCLFDVLMKNTPDKPVWDSLCWPQTSVRTLGKAETWNQTMWIIYALKRTWDNLSNLLPVNFIFINRLNDFVTSNSVPLITASLSILFNCNLGG